MSLIEPGNGLSVEERWEIVKKHAPEAWEFYQNILDGEHTYWWSDKPLQLMNRAILYIGYLAQERDKAFAAGRKAGMEEAAEIACKTTAPVSIGRDKGRHHIAGAQHAAKIIRAKMEDTP